jgi:hypothetical protein
MAIGGAIAGYLPYTTIVRPDALPAAGLLARIYAPVTDLALASLGLVLLLTPTGSAPSPGWRRWAFASSAAMAALAVAATLAPGSVDARVLSIEGPVGPHAFGGALAVFNQLALVTALLILREEVDLDTLTAEVLGVAEQTMQPTRASPWLRPPPGSGVV